MDFSPSSAAGRRNCQIEVLGAEKPVRRDSWYSGVTMAMGAFSMQSELQGAPGGNESSGVMGMLSSFLDTNRDGSVADDVLGFVNKFLQK